jgi:hypothetical protein
MRRNKERKNKDIKKKKGQKNKEVDAQKDKKKKTMKTKRNESQVSFLHPSSFVASIFFLWGSS